MADAESETIARQDDEMMRSADSSGPPSRPSGPARWWRLRPRPENLLLLVSLLATLAVKLLVVHRQGADNLLIELVEASLADVVFFSAVAMLFAALYLCPLPALITRLTLLLAAAVAAWSVLNATWLMATGVQLQPGVLEVLGQDPREFWPVVQTHLARKPAFTVPLVGLVLLVGVWFLWRLIRSRPVSRTWRGRLGRAVMAAVVLVGASLWHWLDVRGGTEAYSGEVIGFSSHWYALVEIVGDVANSTDVVSPARRLPRVGERNVTVPEQPPHGRPNVVVVFLESVSYDCTSLGNPQRTTTPFLVQLASEGVEFVSTRVPVPQTSKAWWAGLTGCTPDIQHDYAEAVPVDEPYESLASLLARAGYRSAFFEMSRGSFECAPGFFANLAFDWAWFRENLQDESSYLGYMNGDDFRMIEPIFQWVDGDEQPFLLVLITSVAHDPYDLPAWYEQEPSEDRYERYLQAIEFTDVFLAEMCAQLQARGLLADTLLCVVGDHGEGFRPESDRGRWAPFEEVIRVPWIIRWPGHVQAGRRIEWPCSQLDLTPTVLSLLGYGVEEAGFDGVDAMQPTDPRRRFYFSTWYRGSPVGYVQGARKLVYWPYTDKLFEYDLASDPVERAPQIVNGPEKERVIADIRQWEQDSRLVIPARRFRERVLYEHWQCFSSGRSAWAYYVP